MADSDINDQTALTHG